MASKTFGNFAFNETSIKDVYTIDVKKYGDNRGYFMETYKEADFKTAGFNRLPNWQDALSRYLKEIE